MLVTVRYTAVSSANNLTWDWMFSGRSLMYNRKRSGPSTEPWGTPEVTLTSSDDSPSSTTVWVRPIRNDCIQFSQSTQLSDVFNCTCIYTLTVLPVILVEVEIAILKMLLTTWTEIVMGRKLVGRSQVNTYCHLDFPRKSIYLYCISTASNGCICLLSKMKLLVYTIYSCCCFSLQSTLAVIFLTFSPGPPHVQRLKWPQVKTSPIIAESRQFIDKTVHRHTFFKKTVHRQNWRHMIHSSPANFILYL